jgi:hypothetical protein
MDIEQMEDRSSPRVTSWRTSMYHERYPDIMFRLAEQHRDADLARRLRPSDGAAAARRGTLASLTGWLVGTLGRGPAVTPATAPAHIADRRPARDMVECPECPPGARDARAA